MHSARTRPGDLKGPPDRAAGVNDHETNPGGVGAVPHSDQGCDAAGVQKADRAEMPGRACADLREAQKRASDVR
jgi:hypothetical protein